MAWFTRRRRTRFPADMLQRLDRFGRVELDNHGSGVDSSNIWQDCVAPFLEDGQADRDGFLADLQTVIADDRGGFATFGAARLVYEVCGGDFRDIPAALPFIDAGIEFKRVRGLFPLHLSPWEAGRIAEREKEIG